ncbi:DEAD/DEAH box helicase family protein [archaeon]|nr:DEAD/DEAH box helicase family protein [archaeon]MBT7128510.1 DEAD/DEAH box helicase family protein [archaeon]
MSLNDINLKNTYDSDEDNILKDFYIPTLKESILYKRIASYYSSSSLVVASEGITSLIGKRGKMKLLINVGLSKEDYEAIREGIENPEKIISALMIKDIEELREQIKINHLKVLSWLIAMGKVEIKVAIIKENAKGILHQKVGLLYDELGSKISFSGSENETANGFIHNIEEFKVFRGWIEDERKYLIEDERKFEKFWSGEGNRVKTISLPEAVEKKLIEIRPKDKIELNKIIDELEKGISKKKLRPYQKEAIDCWMENGKTGVLEMATGSGKTFTSISIIKELSKETKPFLVVIACPFQHLVTQWTKELEDQGISSVKAFGNRKSWVDKVADKVSNLNRGYENLLVLVTTYDTSSKGYFLELIKKFNQNSLYIGDEVHYVGAESRRKGLLEEYSFRLGLSATPSRWMDDEGTKIINDYFGKTVFEFGLEEAIAMKFLTPYKYYPHISHLSDEEMQEYEAFAPRIARLMQGDSKENNERLSLLLIQRQKIITNAIAKYDILEEIIQKEEMDKTLIYCSDKQIIEVPKYLSKKNTIFHRFTSKEKNKERKKILENFEKGVYQVLLAIKCLDEGVDVPSTKTAIIMASSGNPREYIQRRGRILRTHPSKNFSVIHDIIVLPPKGYFYKYASSDMDKKMLKKELKRYMEFSNSSMNPISSTKKVISIMEDYGLM